MKWLSIIVFLAVLLPRLFLFDGIVHAGEESGVHVVGSDQSGDIADRKVASVRFVGLQALSGSFLSFLVKVRERFPTSAEELSQDRLRLMTTGFFESVTSHTTTVGHKKIDIVFTVEEKKPLPVYRLNSISLDGNKKTREKVIMRELQLDVGQELSRTNLLAGMVKLEKLRIFKKVDFRIIPLVEGEGQQADLIIDLEEGMTSVGFIWPTYSSDNADLGGFGPVGGYVNINFMGSGAWIGMGGMWAKNRVVIGGMALPRLGNTHQDLSFGIGYGEREQETYDRQLNRTGGEFKVNVTGAVAYWNIPFDNNLRVLQFFGLLNTTFDQIEGKIPSENAWGPLYSVSLAYDSRDDELETTSGLYPSLRLDLGYYRGQTGSEAYYIRYNPTLKTFFRLGTGHCFAVQVRGGATNHDIPYLGKYQIGGSNDLRGFPEWSIVGTNYFLTNVEYRFPLFRYRSNYGLSGVLFYDMGKAWDIGEDDIFQGIHRAQGIGLRFLSGPIILRLDYGFSRYHDGVYFYFSHLF